VRLVIALGGNALLRRGERPSLAVQRRNMEAAARALAPVLERHAAVITHGNGPQVGWLARRRSDEAVPLDMLDAETEGMLGYLIELALRNVLPARDVVTVLSQVVVDGADAAFAAPTKPIGALLEPAEAARLRAAGAPLVEEPGGFRRVVPSPAPQRLLGLAAVERLLDAGCLVICAGGGGIPVVQNPDGRWRGVEAVVDKDATSALLAEALEADALMLLTDVAAVYREWGAAEARPFSRVTAAELSAQSFAPGSMGPKVAAACGFVEHTGCPAMIGNLGDAEALLAGRAGTQIVPGSQSSK